MFEKGVQAFETGACFREGFGCCYGLDRRVLSLRARVAGVRSVKKGVFVLEQGVFALERGFE